jgi:hypothetical protein
MNSFPVISISAAQAIPMGERATCEGSMKYRIPFFVFLLFGIQESLAQASTEPAEENNARAIAADYGLTLRQFVKCE